MVEVAILGVINLTESGSRDDKILAFAIGDDAMTDTMDYLDLPDNMLEEILFFLEEFKKMGGKTAVFGRTQDCQEALKIITASKHRHQQYIELECRIQELLV